MLVNSLNKKRDSLVRLMPYARSPISISLVCMNSCPMSFSKMDAMPKAMWWRTSLCPSLQKICPNSNHTTISVLRTRKYLTSSFLTSTRQKQISLLWTQRVKMCLTSMWFTVSKHVSIYGMVNTTKLRNLLAKPLRNTKVHHSQKKNG